MGITTSGSFTNNPEDIGALKAAFAVYVLMTKPNDETPGRLVNSLLGTNEPSVIRLGKELEAFFMNVQDSK